MTNEVSTSEAATLLGVSPRTIQLWVDRGILPAWKTSGGHRRISKNSVMACKENFSIPTVYKNHLEKIIVAYQSIVDITNNIVGYEFFYRDSETLTFNATDRRYATSSTIVGLLSQIGIADAVGKSKCFINVDYEMLMDDVILTLLPGKVVFEIPSNIEINELLINRCLFLKSLGYELLLDNYSIHNKIGCEITLFDFVKIDFSANNNIDSIKEIAKKSTVIASRIEHRDCYQTAKKMGIVFFQGRHLSSEKISSEQRLNPHRMILLEILALCVAQHDAIEIEEKIKKEPALCISLLRLVNSSGIGRERKLDSIKNAILMLGINGLQRWVQILLFSYSPQQANTLNPLQQRAFFRGSLLEKIAEKKNCVVPKKEQAFLVGILSLADQLVMLPLEQIINKLNLSQEISLALIHKQGALGKLLLLAEALEQSIFENIRNLLIDIDLNETDFHYAFQESLKFSTSINEY